LEFRARKACLLRLSLRSSERKPGPESEADGKDGGKVARVGATRVARIAPENQALHKQLGQLLPLGNT